MTECSLIEENGRAHFLTKRFDRKNGKKVHMQTLCGMAHYDYRLHRAYSYEQAFNVMRALRLPYSEAKEMFRRWCSTWWYAIRTTTPRISRS